MGVTYCPRCQGNVTHAAGQAYCPRCGWNRLVAAHQVRLLQRLLPVFLLPLVAFGLLMVARSEEWETFLAVVILGLAVLYGGLRSLRRSLELVESVQPVLAPETRPEAFSLDVDEVGRQTRELLKLPRPRPVQLTSTGRVYFGLLVALFAVLELVLLWHLVTAFGAVLIDGMSASDWTLVAGIVFCVMVLGAVPYVLSRQKNLVMNGELGLAKVTRRWRVRGNAYICYELEVGGETLRREVLDCTHRLYKEMAVPVFYDPANPNRQIASCAAYYEVVLPDNL